MSLHLIMLLLVTEHKFITKNEGVSVQCTAWGECEELKDYNGSYSASGIDI